MTTTDLLSRCRNVTKTGNGWQATCPGHEDKNASLCISEGDGGKILLHCHAGCKTDSIVAAIGLQMRNLFPDDHNGATSTRPATNTLQKQGGKLHATLDSAISAAKWGIENRKENKDKGRTFQLVGKWLYQDSNGNECAYVVRFENPTEGRDGKQFQPIRKDGAGWRVGDPAGKWPLYQLPDILKADEKKTVFVNEGEKKTDAAREIGLIATTSAHGAKSAKKTDWTPLAGRDVIILPDNDPSGERYAEDVASILSALNPPARVRILRLPGLPVKGDMVEYLQARQGKTADEIKIELRELAKAAAQWTPSAAQAPQTEVKTSGAGTDQAETTKIQAEFWKLSQSQDKNLTRSDRFKLMAGIALDYLHGRGRFFFHADCKDFATAMFFDSRRKLLLQLSSDAFQSWLSTYIGVNRTEQSFKFVFASLEDEALTGKTTGLQPEMFWAARPGAIYISSGDGMAAKITAGKVELVDNGTDDVLFPAGLTLRPWALTDPKDPVESCRLFNDMRAAAPHAKDLLRLWLCSLPTNQRCKPPLTMAGAIGSGKTRLAVGLFELLGITPRVSAITKNGEDDFWTELNGGGLVCFDNADTRIDWLPDALAAAATDVNREKRQLYTDNKLIQQRARAWVVITSANPTFASDPGLADRVLVIRLERRTEETAESALSDEIGRNRDTGLSWIADTLSKALADKGVVTGNLNRRHPDFATFAVKIGRAIGREAEAVAALQAAEGDKSRFNLENDDLGATLIDFMATRPDGFTGTADTLRDTLKESGNGFDADFWTTKRIGRRIEKLWPHVETMFHAEREKDTHTRLTEYKFAYSAYSQRPFSGKSPCERIYRENLKTPLETTHTTQTETAEDIFKPFFGAETRCAEGGA